MQLINILSILSSLGNNEKIYGIGWWGWGSVNVSVFMSVTAFSYALRNLILNRGKKKVSIVFPKLHWLLYCQSMTKYWYLCVPICMLNWLNCIYLPIPRIPVVPRARQRSLSFSTGSVVRPASFRALALISSSFRDMLVRGRCCIYREQNPTECQFQFQMRRKGRSLL